jgi:NAD(P)-dependent dehydrogenase (short-subunit alcohol dehydrogenase family)
MRQNREGDWIVDVTLKDKVALVTGGGAGIGRAIVDAYRSLGARIAIAEIDPAKVDALKAALGGDALVLQADVTHPADVARAMAAIDAQFGGLDVLVNNVGHHLGLVKTLEAMSDAEIAALYAVNLGHLFTVTRAALPLLRRSGKGGSIINVSSIEAFRGNPYNVAYTSFKHGVIGFTRAMALELAPDNIRVNGIAPETTDSEQVPLDLMLKQSDHSTRTLPLGRYGKPADHAGAAVFFATDMSSWITGTTQLIDGGGLAASGFQRTPDGHWTIGPLVTGDVFTN